MKYKKPEILSDNKIQSLQYLKDDVEMWQRLYFTAFNNLKRYKKSSRRKGLIIKDIVKQELISLEQLKKILDKY